MMPKQKITRPDFSEIYHGFRQDSWSPDRFSGFHRRRELEIGNIEGLKNLTLDELRQAASVKTAKLAPRRQSKHAGSKSSKKKNRR
jgi:hypothetical protein